MNEEETDFSKEIDPEKPLRFLANTDKLEAQAKALVKGLEHNLKSVKAASYLKASGSQGDRTEKAYDSPEYREAVEKYENAMADWLIMSNKRKTAELAIEIWRSKNANRRSGNI